jgi:GDPmannose 4,6-dehydratase
MSVALVTGITGQDGYYLARLLANDGMTVWGLSRNGTIPADLPDVRAAPAADLGDADSLRRAISAVRPDEIYHLAALTSVVFSWKLVQATIDVTAAGTARLLEAIRLEAPRARVFLASSAEIFGTPDRAPQTEATPIRPITPYGAAKACAYHLGRMYRDRHGMHVAIGILYNHESPRRLPSFVSRKITAAAAAIAAGSPEPLMLGNLDNRRDWTAAEDTVRAMPLILRYSEPRAWIVASGETHTVRDWCEIAFAHIGRDWREHVASDPAFWRAEEEVPRVGDSTPLMEAVGWCPERSFADLVTSMVDADLERWRVRATP